MKLSFAYFAFRRNSFHAPFQGKNSGPEKRRRKEDIFTGHQNNNRFARVNWVPALNRILPPDLGVMAAEEAEPSFHARFSARGKVYVYSLYAASAPLSPRLRPFVWSAGPLDPALLDAAGRALAGEHDFSAFRNSGAGSGPARRELNSIRRLPGPLSPALQDEKSAAGAWYWNLEFTGNGFLKQMVRNLVGFMVAAGRGVLSPEDAAALFAGAPRSSSPFATAPAHGLCLRKVLY